MKAFAKRFNNTLTAALLMLSSCLLFSPALFAKSDQEKTQAKLAEVQKSILQKQNNLQKQQTEYSKLSQAQQITDKKIADVAKKLRLTEQQLKQTLTRIKELQKTVSELEKTRDEQVKVFSQQIKSAYLVGRSDYLKALLNQDSPAQLERVLTYYQYLNKARTKALDALQQTLEKLAENSALLAQNQTDLASLLNTQQLEQQQLVALKSEQQQQLATLNTLIETEKQQLDNLKQDEAALAQALQALSEALESLPLQLDLTGLAQIKGKLLWPTKGKVRDFFGKTKSGQLRWKGVLIEAEAGQTVQNIHAGQVIFSDWLKGYGLVIVVEHGKGYMSLYGHNQALLKNVGETVRAGEPIALVGQSGGQFATGVYFEIRHQGVPVDPVDWCH